MSKLKHDIQKVVLNDGTELVPRNCAAPLGAMKACHKCYANSNGDLCRSLHCSDPKNRIWVVRRGTTIPVVKQKPPGKFLLLIEGDIEPHILGPYKSDAIRLKVARRRRLQHGDDDGLFRMDVSGYVNIDTFSGGELSTYEDGE